MTFDELFPFQAVINLEHRKDRLASCREEFKKIGVNPIRKPGIIPKNIENQYARGVVGCLLSHYHILQAAYLLQTNVAVFEDDIMFLHDKYNVENILESTCNELQNIEWDVLYIVGNVMAPIHQITEHLGKLTSHCQNTAGYCVNAKFVEKLLSYIDLEHIDQPIDVIYSSKVVPQNNCYITIPMIAVQKDDYSDIECSDVKYSGYLLDRYFKNLILRQNGSK